MHSEHWKKVEEIFNAALGRPSGEREAFLREACAGDESLMQEVHTRIDSYEQAGNFKKPSDAESFNTNTDGVESSSLIGNRIGPYRLVREIGRGGMGSVYLAVRADDEYQKRVAIKLIKRGMDTDFILRRFRRERQILASLDHLNIGLLLDGGTTTDGLPYFVMEYIEGQNLFRYSDLHKLTIPERLKIFRQVCDAVHYAHQNLVIHRDIKPSNILVTAARVPKLLDFGIAKLLNPELALDTAPPTATEVRLMTPEYASPEQVRGEMVTPASDIYSLGILLYELLTGHSPYVFPSRSPYEMARIICEEEPVHPSHIVGSPDNILPISSVNKRAATLERLCQSRGSTLEGLRKELEGNLDNIILKALQKEQTKRYQSAEQLSKDITNHLEGRAVSASYFIPRTATMFPPVSGQTVAREKTVAVLPLKIMIPMQSGSADDSYLGVGLADALVTRLSNIGRFTVRPTSSVQRYGSREADPFAAGNELGVSFVVDGWIRRAGNRIRVSVQLLDVVKKATVWASQFDEMLADVLGLEDAISAQVAEALVPQLTGVERSRLAKRGTNNAEAFEAYLRGRYYWNSFTEEGFAKAITCYYQAVAIDPKYAAAYVGIADYYNWIGVYGVMPAAECFAAAKEAASKAVELDVTLAEAYSSLGFAIMSCDYDWESAESKHKRALELNPNSASASLWYSHLLTIEARFEEAGRRARRVLELDPLSPYNRHNLGWSYYYARRYQESIAEYGKLTHDEPSYGIGHYGYSWSLRQAGRYEEAINEAAKAVEILGGSPFVLAGLGAAYAAAGNREKAMEVLAQLQTLSDTRFVSSYHLALVHSNLGNKDEAIKLLKQAFADRDAWLVWLGVEPQFDSLRSHAEFARLLKKIGNPTGGRIEARISGALEMSGEHSPVAAKNATRATPRPARNILTPGTQHPVSSQAHQLYQAGRYHMLKRTPEGIQRAITNFERAVEEDKLFALAYANLADCYALLNWYVEPPPANAFDKAKEFALKAVEADENLAEGHVSLAFIKFNYERDWEGSSKHFRRAVILNPNYTTAHHWHALCLTAMGEHDEAVEEIEAAQAINPQSPILATAGANVLYFARRFDEAIAQCHHALDLDPGSVGAHAVLRWAYEHKGMHEEAFEIFEKERAFAGDTPTTKAKLAHVLAASGRTEESRQTLEDLLAHSERKGVTPYEIAVIYAILGETDEAFHWLAQAEREHAVGITYLKVDPHLDNLRTDPRFQDFLRRLGFSV
ncbi:MAG: protein kinase [Pyrinomonadaceae bacterium]